MAEDDDIIDRIYEAALLPELWESLLMAFSRIAEAEGALLHSTRDLRSNGSTLKPFVYGLLVEPQYARRSADQPLAQRVPFRCRSL